MVRDKKERDELILNKVKEEKWIMDGTYYSTLKNRIDNSDYVIYLDYSSIAATIGAVSRTLKNNGKERKDIPGCNERMTFHYLFWVMNWRKNKRNTVLEIINDYDKDKLLVFKNRKSLNKWFKKTFNRKIDTKNILVNNE